MKYVALYEGVGGQESGCDYTIGCNRNYEVIEAVEDNEARQHLLQKWLERGGTGEHGYAKIELFAVLAPVPVPLAQWQGEFDRSRQAERDDEELRKAKQTIARLAAKGR